MKSLPEVLMDFGSTLLYLYWRVTTTSNNKICLENVTGG